LRSWGLALQLRQDFFNIGAGLRLPAGSPTVSHTPSSPSSTGSAGGTSCIQGRLLVSRCTRTMGTRLLCSRQLTS
jgi:hypothetical protein